MGTGWRLLLPLALLCIQLQSSFDAAIYFYAFEIFWQVGIPPELTSYMAIGVGVSDLIGCLLCTVLIERLGRKVLLLAGLGMMSLTLTLLTVTLSLQDSHPWFPYCSIVLIFCFTLFFGAGPSGVAFCAGSELFYQSARPSAMMLMSLISWAELYLLGMLFPYTLIGLGPFCFLIFLSVLVISGIFLFLFLPETKGKSIMEITEEVNRMQRGRICCAVEDTLPEYTATCTKL